MKTSNIVLKFIAVLYLLLMSFGTAYAQADKQFGTRISDSKTGPTLKENIILELDSREKGFMLPRMTTAQRDRLVKNKTADNGLAIYNVDIDCVEFWSERTEKWMSVCGSLPPAKLDLAAGSCTSVTFNSVNYDGAPVHKDIWQQGKAFDPAVQSMKITVKVEAIGTYQISATTDNGYFFSGEGQFQAIGTYDILLKAMGTPTNGYDQAAPGGKKGDLFKFSFNGKVSEICSAIELKIERADLDFLIKPAPSNTYKADGTYIVKKPATLRDGNKISVEVTVNSPGRISITATSNSQLGVKFTGGMNTTANGDYTVVLEPVDGENLPKVNIDATYDLTFSTNAKNQTSSINSQKASIVIKETSIEPLGTKATFGTTKYYAGETLTTSHTISVPVKVLAAGTSTLRLKDASGNYEFVAENVIFDNPAQPTDEQIVVFRAKSIIGLPNTATPMELTLTGDQARLVLSGTDKKVSLPVEIKPVAYTINCTNITSSRSTIIINQEIQETYTIIVKANVTELGEYELKTTTAVQGITFSSTKNGVRQKFTQLGDQDIVLYAEQKTVKPTVKGTTTVTITNSDGNSKTLCDASFQVRVGNNELNILYLKTNRSSDDYHYRLGVYLAKNSFFSETGTYVETGAKILKTVALQNWSSTEYNSAVGVAARAEALAELKKGIYNLIVIDGNGIAANALDASIHTAIEEYINNNKGWLVVAQNIDFAQGSGIFSGLDYSSTTGAASGFGTMLKKFNGNVDTPKSLTVTVDRKTTVVGYPVATNPHFTMTTKYTYKPNHSIHKGSAPVITYDLTNTQFEPLTTLKSNNSKTEAMTMIHKTKKIVILPMLTNVSSRGLLSSNDYNGDMLTYSYTEYQNNTNIYIQDSYFLGNLFISIITDLMK